MTLITMGFDAELLIRQLRQRLAYVDGRIAPLRPQENADNPVTNFTATGALLELHNEREWLQGLTAQIERGSMKTITELQERFNAIHDALHLSGDEVAGYCVGQLTALLWAIDSYPTWTECHITADEISKPNASGVTRPLLEMSKVES